MVNLRSANERAALPPPDQLWTNHAPADRAPASGAGTGAPAWPRLGGGACSGLATVSVLVLSSISISIVGMMCLVTVPGGGWDAAVDAVVARPAHAAGPRASEVEVSTQDVALAIAYCAASNNG